MDKASRKKILLELKQKEQEKLIAELPMSTVLLHEYFDFLDAKIKSDGSTLKQTEVFCSDKGIDFLKVKEWAANHGGFDDAEILWNVEEKYEFLLNKK